MLPPSRAVSQVSLPAHHPALRIVCSPQQGWLSAAGWSNTECVGVTYRCTQWHRPVAISVTIARSCGHSSGRPEVWQRWTGDSQHAPSAADDVATQYARPADTSERAARACLWRLGPRSWERSRELAGPDRCGTDSRLRVAHSCVQDVRYTSTKPLHGRHAREFGRCNPCTMRYGLTDRIGSSEERGRDEVKVHAVHARAHVG